MLRSRRGRVPTELRGVKMFGIVEIQAAAATTSLRGITLARLVALRRIDQSRIVTESRTTPTLSAVPRARQREALIFA